MIMAFGFFVQFSPHALNKGTSGLFDLPNYISEIGNTHPLKKMELLTHTNQSLVGWLDSFPKGEDMRRTWVSSVFYQST